MPAHFLPLSINVSSCYCKHQGFSLSFFVCLFLHISVMPKMKITCSSCGEVYEWKLKKEFMTWIKKFSCPKCHSENTIPLWKVWMIINNIIMVIFGILSVIVLFDTNWSRWGISWFFGSLVWNSLVFLPFIFSFISFIAHQKIKHK